MGTPVPYKPREHEYSENIKEPQIVTRQLTEEERRHYDSLGKPGKRIVAYNYQDATLFSEDKESEEMKSTIERPSKEALAEMCRKYPSRYQAGKEIAKELGCSRGCIENWIAKFELKDLWKNTDQPEPQPTPEGNMKVAEQESCSGTSDEDTREFDGVVMLELEPGQLTPYNLNTPKDPNELKFTAQPGDGQIIYTEEAADNPAEGIVAKIYTATYKVGGSLVFINFVSEKVMVNNSDSITFEEAAALVELLNDIL